MIWDRKLKNHHPNCIIEWKSVNYVCIGNRADCWDLSRNCPLNNQLFSSKIRNYFHGRHFIHQIVELIGRWFKLQMWRKVILSILFVCTQSVGCSTLMTLWDSLYFSFVYRNKKTRFSLEIEFIIFKWQFWIFEWLSPSLRQHIKYTNTHINIIVRKSNEFFLHFSLPLFVASPSLTAKYIICVMCVCVCISRVCLKNAWFSRFVIECTCLRAVSMWVDWVCVCDINRIDFVVPSQQHENVHFILVHHSVTQCEALFVRVHVYGN